jgi:hypothetical protein
VSSGVACCTGPSGSGSSGSRKLGPLSGAAGLCIARTQDTSSDDIGFTQTAAGGAGFGEGAGWGIYYEVSSCSTLPCLSKWFAYAGAGFEYAFGATMSVFWGNWNSHGVPTTFGADVGISMGEGVQASEGFSYTWVNKYTCGSDWVCKAKANTLRAGWDGLTRPVQWIVNNLAWVISKATAAAKALIRLGKV